MSDIYIYICIYICICISCFPLQTPLLLLILLNNKLLQHSVMLFILFLKSLPTDLQQKRRTKRYKEKRNRKSASKLEFTTSSSAMAFCFKCFSFSLGSKMFFLHYFFELWCFRSSLSSLQPESATRYSYFLLLLTVSNHFLFIECLNKKQEKKRKTYILKKQNNALLIVEE